VLLQENYFPRIHPWNERVVLVCFFNSSFKPSILEFVDKGKKEGKTKEKNKKRKQKKGEEGKESFVIVTLTPYSSK
jgi:hypothetical protein